MRKIRNFMESYQKDLEKTLEKIKKLFDQYDIDFCFIGGIAVNYYGHQRTTDDVDLLVDRHDKEKIQKIPIGFMRDITGNGKIFNFHNPSTRLEILYSGEHAGNKDGPEYVDPALVKKDDRFINLKFLVFYKVASGFYGKRYQDWGDVQNLIKKNALQKDFLDKFDIQYPMVVKKYKEIWSES